MRIIDADALMQRLGITDMDCHKCAWADKPRTICKRGSDFEDACIAIENAPTITQNPDEWCTDCKEYDSEKHCCPRFNHVIRKAMEQRWIPVTERLPDEDYCTGRGIQHSESVLVTVVHHANDDDVFVDMACTVDGKWQLTYPFDDDPDIPKWCEIIAWMPLPKSYSGKTESRDYENKGDDY